MIWRLMASILVMSDTGSVSLTLSHTDWPTEQQCREIVNSHYQPPKPIEMNGHAVVAKISASCVPVETMDLPPPGMMLPRPRGY
jgi:hypothetical protein